MRRPVLLVIAHGSRDPRHAATVHALVERVRSLRPGLRVETGFLDFNVPSVHGLLESLAAAGFKQAIGSSAPRANVDLILDLTKTAGLFAAMSTSEDTQRGKPDPQVFLVAAERLGVAPERCVVFEDAVAGVQAARAGGMRCIAVSFVGHHSEESLRQAGADRVVDTLAEVSVQQVVQLLG